MSIKCIALLRPVELNDARAALGPRGDLIAVGSPAELLEKLTNGIDERIVLDPSLLTVVDARSIAARSTKLQLPIVVYASLAPCSLEVAVVLARSSTAAFVFRGDLSDKFDLAHALTVAPSIQLGNAIVSRLSPQLEALPYDVRNVISTMLLTGKGPVTPNDLAGACGVARRSLDRWLSRAGFAQARLIIGVSRLVAGYQSVSFSSASFARVAKLLGYKNQRSMDSDLQRILRVTSSRLRRSPLPVTVAASVAADHLTMIAKRHGRRKHRNASRGSTDTIDGLMESTSNSGFSLSRSGTTTIPASSDIYEGAQCSPS